jgi:hypothetical protein
MARKDRFMGASLARSVRYDPRVLTTRGLILTSVLVTAMIACNGGDSSDPPEPCFGCSDPSPGTFEDVSVVVDNRTEHSVPITIRELSSLWIERKVLEGTIAVPIAPAARGTARQQELEPQGRIVLSLQLGIITETEVLPATGGIVAIGSGPAVLAVGKGRLIVRTRDGADVLEAEDPRAVTVLPVEREVTACTEEALGAESSALPPDLSGAISFPVESVTRDDEGCRLFRFDHNGVPLEYHACVPDAAYPFADGDALWFTALETKGVRFVDIARTSLELLPVRFQSRHSTSAGGMTVGYVAQTTCATVTDGCKDVVLPAKVSISFDGKTSESRAVGESIVFPNDATRTVFVLGARSRPVVDPGCSSRDTESTFAPTDVLLAIVQKPVP